MSADSQPPRRGWPRRLALALASLVVVFALLPAALLGLLMHTEAPWPWLLARMPGLQLEGWQGRPVDARLTIARLRWRSADGAELLAERIEIEPASIDWRLDSTRPLRLHLKRLAAERLQWTSPPGPQPRPAPPAHLKLPLSLRVDDVALGSIRVDTQSPIERLSARLHIGADDGRRHELERLTAQWRQWRLDGQARIETSGAMAVVAAGQVAAEAAPPLPGAASAEQPPARPQGRFSLHGPLRALQLDSDLALGSAAMSLQAGLRPFDPWPLPRLSATSRGLDLRTLDPALPQTRLDADIAVVLAGWDRPAEGHVLLSNRAPGAVTQGALPLKRAELRLSGRPDQLDRLAIEALTLELAGTAGDAGRIDGKGLWQAHRLTLDLQVRQLQPARLDARAPGIDASGPLSLAITGLPRPDGRTADGQWSVEASVQWRGQAPAGLTAGRAGADAGTRANAEAGTGAGASRLPFAAAARLQWSPQLMRLSDVTVQAGSDHLSGELEGSLAPSSRGARFALASRGTLRSDQPLRWWPAAAAHAAARAVQRAEGHWNLTAQGPWPLPQSKPWTAMTGSLEIDTEGSRLADAPLQGRLQARADQPGRWHGDGRLDWAGNRLQARAEWPAPNSAPTDPAMPDADLQLHLDAPQRLAPLLTAWPQLQPWWPAQGRLQARIRTWGPPSGAPPADRSEGVQFRLSAQAEDWTSPALRLRRADVAAQAGVGEGAALRLDLTAAALSLGSGPQPVRLDQVAARIDGRPAQHQVSLDIQSPLRPPAWTENLLGHTGSGTRLQARGIGSWLPEPAGASAGTAGTGAGYAWSLGALALNLRARESSTSPSTPTVPDWLAGQGLKAQLRLGPAGEFRSLQFEPGRVSLPTTGLRWQEASWAATGSPRVPTRFKLMAELDTIQAARVLQRLQPEQGWLGDLSLGGSLFVDAGEQFVAEAVLERERGDLALRDDAGSAQALGLSELRLAFSAREGRWQFAQGLAGSRIGEMATAIVVETDPRARWPAASAPVQGVMQARVGQLAAWGAWIPAGWRLDGELEAGASLGGRLDALQFTGRLGARRLSLRNPVQGAYLDDGELELRLEGDRATLERASVRAGDGRLTLSGEARLGAQPQAQLRFDAERFRVLGRLDRRIVASGSGQLNLAPQRLQASGRLVVDEGLFDFSRADAPRLDDDVEVRRAGQPGTATSTVGPRSGWQAQIDLGVDLGQRLRLRGRGLDTGLAGQLRIATPANRLALTGSVRAVGGTYQAYGQRMEIERGEVAFNGAPEAARLDVLAVRPNLDVKVGVAVSGTPANPRIRLVSEPEMTEFDKLSWLVLGRGPEGLGRTDTALIQRAAVALLAGEGSAPGDNLLASIGLTDFSVRQTDGDTRETVISLGRQLSRRWYVGYERSLNATLGTWQLVYRAAQRFTLRAQWGADNAVDAIWSWRWQ